MSTVLNRPYPTRAEALVLLAEAARPLPRERVAHITGADELAYDSILFACQSLERYQALTKLARARVLEAAECWGWVVDHQGLTPDTRVHPLATRNWDIKTNCMGESS